MKIILDLHPNAASLLQTLAAHDGQNLKDYMGSILRTEICSHTESLARAYDRGEVPPIVQSARLVRDRRKA